MFATPDIEREDRPDGSVVFRSRKPLAAYPSSVAAVLRDWAIRDPGHPLIAERDTEGRPGGLRTAGAGTGIRP